MQYIPNIMFWLQAAMATVAIAVGVAAVIFLLSLFGVGLGVGRVWNAKWKMGLPGFIISLLIALLTSVLGAVYVGMGHIKDTVLTPSGRTVVLEECTRSLTDNSRLMEAAYKEGVKNMINAGVDADSLDADTTQFIIPGETEEARRTNKEQFIAGVVKVIAKGEPVKKNAKVKTKTPSLLDSKPFCYGYEPISRDADGSLYSKLEESLQGREEQPISVEDPFWFNSLCGTVVEKSLKNLTNSVCKEIDSQRTSLLVVLITLLLLQIGIISWLALSDIRPRIIDIK